MLSFYQKYKYFIIVFILLVAVWVVSSTYSYFKPDSEYSEEYDEELDLPASGTERFDDKRHKTPGELILDGLKHR